MRIFGFGKNLWLLQLNYSFLEDKLKDICVNFILISEFPPKIGFLYDLFLCGRKFCGFVEMRFKRGG